MVHVDFVEVLAGTVQQILGLRTDSTVMLPVLNVQLVAKNLEPHLRLTRNSGDEASPAHADHHDTQTAVFIPGTLHRHCSSHLNKSLRSLVSGSAAAPSSGPTWKISCNVFNVELWS